MAKKGSGYGAGKKESTGKAGKGKKSAAKNRWDSLRPNANGDGGFNGAPF